MPDNGILVKPLNVLVLGAGEMASGTALRLHRCGFRLLLTEIPEPLAVRRLVSFSDAVHEGSSRVEEVRALRIESLDDADEVDARGEIPLLVDRDGRARSNRPLDVLVDGRMLKGGHGLSVEDAAIVIGMGPGFTAGKDCHAAVETARGHSLGRVVIGGPTHADTGVPGLLGGVGEERVLRAPEEGRLESARSIGDRVRKGETIATVGSGEVLARIDGTLRGLIRPGTQVRGGLKVGDIDPREDLDVQTVSDKALAIAGGVLEAILRNGRGA